MELKMLAAVSLSLVLLHGCASTPEDVAREIQADNKEAANEIIELAPDWFLQPRNEVSEGFYAAGTGLSEDLMRARQEAELMAEYNLAKLSTQTISGLEQYFSNSQGADSFVKNSKIVIEKVIAETDVSGYQLKNSSVHEEKGMFRYYVEVFYPRSVFNKRVKDRLVSAGVVEDQAQKAIEDLRDRVSVQKNSG